MGKIELLAPAGTMESLYAAVQAGADAVYLGGNKFSARAYASNFDDEGMARAVEYCHLYGVKIYVTINTLMKESEIKEAFEYAKFLYSIGVDALIIQDLGLADLIRKALPNFELHASTQMTIHNAEGILFLKSIGFKRIVLSRELSLKEIEYVSKELGIETEIFVHGALCVCYSGQCLMSSMIGGRSGNRGRCAQSCRLPYTIVNKKNGEERKGYILSPKDTCTIENIKEIIESGAASLKIEGRMKRPEYVAGVVQSYRKAIDDVLKQQSFKEKGKTYIDKEKYNETKNNFNASNEKKRLMQLFNREGFSKAYLFGNVGKDMMAYSFPKNTGIDIGKVDKDLTIVLKENISLKDGVRNGEEGFTVSKIIKNDIEVEGAYSGDRVKILPSNYKNGYVLYKTSDIKLLNELEKFYKNPYEKKIDLKLEVKFKIDEPITLFTFYEGKKFETDGQSVQKALKRPLDKERIVESLSKTGDITFKFSDIEFREFEEGFLPVSSINEVRRNLFSEIENYILNKSSKKEVIYVNKIDTESKFYVSEDTFSTELPKTMIYISNEEQLKAFLEYNFQNVVINPFENLSFKDLERLKGRKVFLRLPNIVRTEFEYICTVVEEKLNNIEGIITANLGLINRFKGKTNIIGDYKLNIFNNFTLGFYKNFISGSCLSVELNKKELKEVCKKVDISAQVLVYGKVEVMVSEYCAIGSVFGGKTSCENCNRACDRGDFSLKDRKDEEFILKTDKFCRSYIYNSVPINLISNMEELKAINIKSYRLDFIDEDYVETKKILQALENGKWESSFEGFTRGHYKRGVE
jgi:putative protease